MGIKWYDILGTFYDKTGIDSDIDLIVSVRTPAIVRNKTADSSIDLSQNSHIQLVAIKAYFMNKICQLKGYLCYKTITSQNVSSEAQIKNCFIL